MNETEQWRNIAVDRSVAGTATMNKMELVKAICVAEGLTATTARKMSLVELVRWWNINGD